MSEAWMMSRRGALLAAACALAATRASSRTLGGNSSISSPVPLPGPEQIRRDYQAMVDFGARLPGDANHLRFVDWMGAEFKKAGLLLGPCESFPYRRWEPKRWSLDIIDGQARKTIEKVTYFVRSASTGPDGVTGSLVYGGRIEVAGYAAPPVFPELPAIPKGAIVVFDGTLPRMTMGTITHPHFVHMREGETENPVDAPCHRLWTTPAYPIDALLDRGVAAVAIIMNVSSDQIAGNFSPHSSTYKPKLPALFVGSDVGIALRDAAKGGHQGHLTLDAQWVDDEVPQLTAVLPGETDEVMIVDTHTDGQNFVEENGCIAMLQLARYFASRPKGERLRRSLVFAGWPGHMSGALPEATGWALAHPDMIKRAAAAFTIEHLGSSQWEDLPGKGYAPTGRNEYMNCPTTAGPLTDLVVAGIKRHALFEHGVEPGPGFTTGRVFHNSGIPHFACIGGPAYLLSIAANGHMDKLDADLAARQTAMIAELIAQADRIPIATLKGSDPSLGKQPATGPDTSRRMACSTRTQ